MRCYGHGFVRLFITEVEKAVFQELPGPSADFSMQVKVNDVEVAWSVDVL
jgi:hypothetical protein